MAISQSAVGAEQDAVGGGAQLRPCVRRRGVRANPGGKQELRLVRHAYLPVSNMRWIVSSCRWSKFSGIVKRPIPKPRLGG